MLGCHTNFYLLCASSIVVSSWLVTMPAEAQLVSCSLSPSSGSLSFDQSVAFQSTVAVVDIVTIGAPSQLQITRPVNFLTFPANYFNDVEISYQFQLTGANSAESQPNLTSDAVITLLNPGTSQLRLQVRGTNRNSQGFVAGDYRLQFRVSCSSF